MPENTWAQASATGSPASSAGVSSMPRSGSVRSIASELPLRAPRIADVSYTGYWLVLLVACVVGCALTATGWLLGALARRPSAAQRAPALLAGALLVAAALPLAGSAREDVKASTGPRVPAYELAALPVDEYTLNSLCSPPDRRDPAAPLMRQAGALGDLARRHPDWTLDAHYFSSDEDAGEHTERMTVRQLAQNQLEGLREFPGCQPQLQRDLEAAID